MMEPWRKQHNPHFTATGEILLFNNEKNARASNVLSVDPETNEVEGVFAGKGLDFYSRSVGEIQLRPNGNVLIVISEEGRMIEVAPDVGIAVEFNNIFDYK